MKVGWLAVFTTKQCSGYNIFVDDWYRELR